MYPNQDIANDLPRSISPVVLMGLLHGAGLDHRGVAAGEGASMSDLVKDLQDQIDSMLIQLTERDAEIERLQGAKRRALAIADERSKTNVELRRRAENAEATVLDQFKEIERLQRAIEQERNITEASEKSLLAEIERLRAKLAAHSIAAPITR